MKPSKSELTQMLERERTAKLICAELNNFVDLESTLKTVIAHVKQLAGCEEVSIRLPDDQDYPYYVFNGSPAALVKKENKLCRKDEQNNRTTLPSQEDCLLGCVCDFVLTGRFNPSLPFFTQKGSFWSNNTAGLFSAAGYKEARNRTKDHCNLYEYESVALIPIKARGEIIGLIQLNDKCLDIFSKDLVEYMEMIGEQIGLAVKNSLIYIKQSTTDTLTNVLNRRGLFNDINLIAQLSKRHSYNVGIMMIDVDCFKEINDTYGHRKGDEILQRITGIIKNSIRTSDVFGRYGGDEFLLFLSPIELDALPHLAEKIRHSVETQTKDDFPVTISIGVANGLIETDHTKEVDLLIQKADESLYEAKNSGRNKFMFSNVYDE